MSPLAEALLLILLLLGSAYFSGIETGIISVNRVRLRHLTKRENRRAVRLLSFCQNPDRMLSTTLVGTNLCNIAFTVVAASVTLRMVSNDRLGNLLASVLTTLVILVFGEYLPKAWFQSNPLQRSLRFVGLLELFARAFVAITVPLTALIRVILPAPRDAELQPRDALISRRDVQYLLSKESGASPDISEQRRRMILGVFSLAEKTARDVMIPRNRMIVIQHDTPVQEVLELASRNDIKSFPVVQTQENRITGILKLSDLYEHLDDPAKKLPDIIRPPQYVDEDLPADELLPRLRMSRQPMLLIRNARGEVTGFVTTEVVLEEIVGPLYG